MISPAPAPSGATGASGATVRLSFDRGTLVLDGDPPPGAVPSSFRVDERSGGRLRAPAIAYRTAVARLMRAGCALVDEARGYEELELTPGRQREPFPHQREALEAWWTLGRRGVVVLPTGAGKTYVAEMAIARVGRSALVVVPTLDLMNQWMRLLGAAFGWDRVGALGGGSHDVRELTVTTYDSAYLHMDRLGGRFGLLVFDECHHLPGPSYAQAAECAIAPFRLGLTATPERQDGGETLLEALVGPTVYRRDIRDLAGEYLADYEVVRLRVELTPEERERYERDRAIYRGFVEAERIRMSSPSGWGEFVRRSCRSREGRRAWRAWRDQRRMTFCSEGKLQVVGQLLVQHADEQVLVFTAENDAVYDISRRHLMPAITHQTPTDERQRILRAFDEGGVRGVVTSKVLNEGVDMPTASVGIVLSGSASVREHVQRLGRILRRGEGKEAVLYEVVTGDTGEEHTSARRREHGAYR